MKALAEIGTGLSGTRRDAVIITGPHKNTVYAIADDNEPAVQIGQTCYVEHEFGDQYAKIIDMPEDVSTGGQWSTEFGSLYWVPKRVTEMFKDTSWHNDMCPSFVWAEDEETILRLWVEHYLPDMREGETKRYLVQLSPDGCSDPDELGYEDFETDDLAEAIAKMEALRPKMLAIRQAKAAYVPEPPTNSKPVAKGPRFVLLVGAIHEQYPDCPEAYENGAVVCWDRQERKAVFTLHKEYAQATCLELIGQSGPEGFCDWFNGLSDEALASEGIKADNIVWDDWEDFLTRVKDALNHFEVKATYEIQPGFISIPLEDGSEWVWGVDTGKWHGYVMKDDKPTGPRFDLNIPIEGRNASHVAEVIFNRIMATFERAGAAMPINNTVTEEVK